MHLYDFKIPLVFLYALGCTPVLQETTTNYLSY
jgi:hypothetical protein